MTNVKKLSEIEAKPTPRNMTWFPELDYLYGVNDLPEYNLGMPKGKISLWAGQSGVGKSRLCIEVAKRFSTNYINGVVLYFQTESPLSDFASWAKDTKQYDKIYCSGENKIDEMVKIIYQVKPKLIFIDSVNEIEEFENGNKKEARRLIKGIDGKPGLKKATHDMDCHTILLGQLNQDDKTIKGGTSLPHLVDIALNVVKTDENGVFRVEVGTKHRYGSTDNTALFRHTNDGVVEYVVTPNGPRRVKAMTASGFVTVDAGGMPDYNDSEYREHVTNCAKQQGIDLNNLGPKKSLLTKLNEGVGKMFGLE